MQKAVFRLFLALNADGARIHSFNEESIYASITKDTKERPWAGTRHDNAIASHASENPRLFQPRATTISLLWSRVSPLPKKAPAAVWNTHLWFKWVREKSQSNLNLSWGKNSVLHPDLDQTSLDLCIFVVIHVHSRLQNSPSALLGQCLLRLLPFFNSQLSHSEGFFF